MSASGKSSGKGGMPSPGGGKGGGETSPTPMPGMPNNYNVANDVYGSGLRINQPMSGYYNQFPAPGNNYAPPVYPGPPKPDTPALPKPPPDYNIPYNVGGGGYSPYGGGYSPYGATSPYGFYSNGQQQDRFPQAAQTVRPGQVQDQGTPFDRLIAQATNQPTQAPAQPPAQAPAQAPTSVQNANGTYNFNHPVHGMMNDLSKHGYDSMVADAAQISGQAAPATVTDPRATASGNGRYSFNHPQYGQIDDLTEEGLQSMIASSGGVSSFGIY